MNSLALLLFLNLAVATWVAWLADRRGRNFWVYLIFCFVLPGTAFVVAVYLLIFVRRQREQRA